jgi:hypothetical protein
VLGVPNVANLASTSSRGEPVESREASSIPRQQHLLWDHLHLPGRVVAATAMFRWEANHRRRR